MLQNVLTMYFIHRLKLSIHTQSMPNTFHLQNIARVHEARLPSSPYSLGDDDRCFFYANIVVHTCAHLIQVMTCNAEHCPLKPVEVISAMRKVVSMHDSKELSVGHETCWVIESHSGKFTLSMVMRVYVCVLSILIDNEINMNSNEQPSCTLAFWC